MKNAKGIGGALLGVAMALTGCAGGATGASPASLADESVVASSIDGRTDLFLDPMLSTHLLTANEVNGSPTAIPVEVQVAGDELLAWRLGTQHADADLAGRFQIVGTVDLGTAVAIDNETHPGDPTTIVIPGGALGGLRGAGPSGSRSIPRLHVSPPAVGLIIHWGASNGIPDETDVDILRGTAAAHPGCA